MSRWWRSSAPAACSPRWSRCATRRWRGARRRRSCSAQLGVASAISPNERLQYRLHPWTSFVIVPLFALANVGIHIDGHLIAETVASPITLGIVAGYVVGKPLGTVVGAALVSRSLLRGIGRGLSWPVIAAGGVANGLGFTVSLLISSIAFR